MFQNTKTIPVLLCTKLNTNLAKTSQKTRKIGDKRPIHIITRSPNQYPNYKTSNEIKPINK